MLAGGVAMLWVGGEAFVRGGVGVARVMKLSPLLIGMTLIGFGTSLPELVTSLSAALEGHPGLAVGNVVGSNIANILLILGAGAALATIPVKPDAFRSNAVALSAATIVSAWLIRGGTIDRVGGAALLLALALYIGFAYVRERNGARSGGGSGEAGAIGPYPRSLALGLAMAGAGIVLVAAGGYVFVQGAIGLAGWLGVPGSLVGLTVVAVGTSLPELAVTVVASLRRQSDVALGNIVGSCLFNLLGILGATALAEPIRVPPSLQGADLLVMVAATGLMMLFAGTGLRISRWEGWTMLVLYVAYIAWHGVTRA
ncbi:MAG: calcium/sodium antiporter [Alphaproteobacteria bacterium]|nr:calcium/sodium antiporter [Alphaproteobacteria bacterium]